MTDRFGKSLSLEGVPHLAVPQKRDTETVSLFRRRFTVDGAHNVARAQLAIFADARYHLWVNGTYVGRGPSFFNPRRMPVMVHDLQRHLRSGQNVIAVSVLARGFSTHNHIPPARPGLVAKARIETANAVAEHTTDSTWCVDDSSGWLEDVPRRSWAIDCVEHFDARIAPTGWQQVLYDDSHWDSAEILRENCMNAQRTFIYPELPTLCQKRVPVAELLGIYAVQDQGYQLDSTHPSSAFGHALTTEPWLNANDAGVNYNRNTGAISVRDLAGGTTALVFDLGREYSGAAVFTMESASGGTVDVGWGELLREGRPAVLSKGNTYADRFVAQPGHNEWMPMHFSAGRFLMIVLRGFCGPVRFERLGWLATEPDLNWSGSVCCNDARLNQIWSLCKRTQRVGTQEGLMDCPTREQAAYVGDGNLTANWIGRLTGSYSYWRHLIEETFAVQGPTGLVRTQVFSGRTDVLIDYELLAVIGVRDYLRETGDLYAARAVVDACSRVLSWFETWRNDDHLCGFDLETWQEDHPLGDNIRWLDAGENPEKAVDSPYLHLFIDHPGWGCHNIGEPGIDRRGINAALNALYVLALRAQADILDACDRKGSERLRSLADTTAAAATNAFWNEKEQAFVDGWRNGEQLRQVSQQTNVWCIRAGFADRGRRENALRRILRPDPTMACCSPYFYSYLLPLLAEFGMHSEALELIRKGWGRMLDQEATTLWETFAGDELDSLCHPWSGAPLDFLLRHAAGIGPLSAGQSGVALHPRPDLMETMDARVETLQGTVRISWQRNRDDVDLRGELPENVTGILDLPDGAQCSVAGVWHLSRHLFPSVDGTTLPPLP